jgi:Mg-chelatase subunit ChlI
VSAFGNVGLSLGSNKHAHVSFAADLHVFSQVLLVMAMLMGRTRELPSQVDGSLQLESSETISEAFLKPGAVVRRRNIPPASPPSPALPLQPSHDESEQEREEKDEEEEKDEDEKKEDEEEEKGYDVESAIEPIRDSTPDTSLPANSSNI